MIYIIFLIVIIISAVILLLPIMKGDAAEYIIEESASEKKNTEDEKKLQDLHDKIESTKLALKDLDLEHNIGKISNEDFDLLKKELLSDWVEQEEIYKNLLTKVPKGKIKKTDIKKSNISSKPEALKQKFCSSCGKKVEAEDKFCSSCGKSLKNSKSKNKLSGFLLLILFSFFSKPVKALDIEINIINGTVNKPVKIENLIIYKMQNLKTNQFKSVKNIGPQYILKDVNIDDVKSLLIHGIYKEISFFQVLNISDKEELKTNFLVFETENKYSSQIKTRTFINLKYHQNTLIVQTLYRFQNNMNKSFSEKNKGLVVAIPKIASNKTVSIGVENIESGLEWLNVSPEPTAPDSDLYYVPISAKPGDQYIQVQYFIPYKDKKAELKIGIPYPQAEPMDFSIEPRDISVKIKEDPKWSINWEEVEVEGQTAVKLPLLQKQITFLFSGGSEIQDSSSMTNTRPQEKEQSHGSPIEIKSPVSIEEKFIFSIVVIILFFIFLSHIQSNPAWLKSIWLKELKKIKYRLDSLKDLPISDEKKTKLKEKLESRQNALSRWFEK
ncbi:MAG: zinc ribbon domain-containing protein [Spirochaetia bacterium]|nr:zinc ribbon domain-containing protein [Spirochaetia bacterium]